MAINIFDLPPGYTYTQEPYALSQEEVHLVPVLRDANGNPVLIAGYDVFGNIIAPEELGYVADRYVPIPGQPGSYYSPGDWVPGPRSNLIDLTARGYDETMTTNAALPTVDPRLLQTNMPIFADPAQLQHQTVYEYASVSAPVSAPAPITYAPAPGYVAPPSPAPVPISAPAPAPGYVAPPSPAPVAVNPAPVSSQSSGGGYLALPPPSYYEIPGAGEVENSGGTGASSSAKGIIAFALLALSTLSALH